MEGEMKKSLILFLVLLFALNISCSQNKSDWKGSIEIVDGVTIVKNPKDPMYGEEVFSIEEELFIGNHKLNEEPVFISAEIVRVDDSENIYVLDFKASQIKVFDQTGNPIRTIGRKGQGPGEYQLVRYMDIPSSLELMILDLGNKRITHLSLQGEIINEVSTGKYRFLSMVRPDSKGNYYGTYRLFKEGGYLTNIVKFDENLNITNKIATYESKRPAAGTIEMATNLPHFQVTKDDNIVWGFDSEYEFTVMDIEGQIIKKIIKDFNPQRITDIDQKRMLKERFTDTGRSIPEGYKIIFPENFPAYRHFTIDDQGRFFVQTYKYIEGKGQLYDVFDCEGKYLAQIPLKIIPRAWKKEKLYTIEENEDGFQMVKRYKVTWCYNQNN